MWKINKIYMSMLFNKKNITIVLFFVLVFILRVFIAFKSNIISLNDFLILLFYGHGIGYFSLIDFLNLIVFNGVPIYILCDFLEREKNFKNICVTIRLGKMNKWFNSIISCGITFITFYILITLIISITFGLIFNMDMEGFKYTFDYPFVTSSPNLNLFYLCVIILVIKSLEIVTYFIFICLIYILIRNVTVGFLIVQGSYLAYLLHNDLVQYIPIGMGSLARISNNQIVFFDAVTILISTNILLYIVARKCISIK